MNAPSACPPDTPPGAFRAETQALRERGLPGRADMTLEPCALRDAGCRCIQIEEPTAVPAADPALHTDIVPDSQGAGPAFANSWGADPHATALRPG